jgi:hypothetical protein
MSQSTSTSTAVTGTWNARWLVQFPWLQCSAVGFPMFCQDCVCFDEKHGFSSARANKLLTGTTNYNVNALLKHDKSKAHTTASAWCQKNEVCVVMTVIVI